MEAGGALTPLAQPALGLALDGSGRAWFVAGASPVLHELDVPAIAAGAPSMPLRVARSADASTPAVEALLDALRHAGPYARRARVDLIDATGHAGPATVIELPGP